jgi:polysaccharide pyruvyl transferase WcaK-like protein
MKYTVTTRALKNAGDFIIHKRAVQALCKVKGVRPNELLTVRGDKKLPLDKVNKTKALIICGGPALEPDFYPNVYPLVPNIYDLEVPVFLFGVGGGFGKGDVRDLKLSSKSLLVLRRILLRGGAISVRDPESAKLLARYRLENTVTGCPVYFHPAWDGKLHTPENMKHVLFTPGPMLLDKKLAVHQKSVLKRLRAKFGLIGVGCHRGAPKGLDTRGCKVVNVTGSADKIEVYRAFDVHVGYRVHAHIWFTSMGRPSFLIPVDTRGTGAAQLMGVHFQKLWKFLNPAGIINTVVRESKDWERYQNLPAKLQGYWQKTEAFLSKLP